MGHLDDEHENIYNDPKVSVCVNGMTVIPKHSRQMRRQPKQEAIRQKQRFYNRMK